MNKEYMKTLEVLGWTVHEYDDTYGIYQQSPAGEDFGFEVSKENFVDEIKNYANDFDPDEHIEMWVMAKYNGGNGIPSVRVLVEDADAIEKMLEELAVTLCEVRRYIEEE